MGAFSGVHALVVGLGASGDAAAHAIVAEGGTVRVSEQRSLEALDLTPLDGLGIEVLAGGHREADLDGADLVVLSPGVPEHAPIVGWARERGLETISELEVGARLAAVTPCIAVTGTNGKTTTTAVIAAIMRAGGMDAVACGNIGLPFSTAAREGHEALAVEASSFQLRFISSFHPRVSVLLNVAPDHLDWHGSMSAYEDAKARIFEFQTDDDDVHVGNTDDASARVISQRAGCRTAWFGLGEPVRGAVGFADGVLTANLTQLRGLDVVAPVHRGLRADMAAAAAATLSFGLDPEAVRAGIEAFEPMAHRGEVVASVSGIEFIDDSKATNPHAALAALEGRTGVVLIAGGLAKGLDLAPLAEAADTLVGVVAMGTSAGQVEDLFSGIRPVRRAESIEQAAELALELARTSVPPGGFVVLAPGAASQDQFVDYRERGERFAQAARVLARAEVEREGGPDVGA